MKFAVLGDLHYVKKDEHADTYRGQRGYTGEVGDLNRYLYFHQQTVPEVFRQIKTDGEIELLFQLGDFVQGNCDNEPASIQESENGLALLKSLGIPCIIAMGNHDDPVFYREKLLPGYTQMNKADKYDDSFSFPIGETLFIVLNSAAVANTPESLQWLENVMRGSTAYERVFIFSHDPVYPVSRNFFTDRKFADEMRRLLGQYRIDCHFAGHTHDQNFSSHSPNGKTYLQGITSALGFLNGNPLPVQQAKHLILPDAGCFYYGFLEDTCPGSWIKVSIEKNRVSVEHRNAGTPHPTARFEWQKKGDISYYPSPYLRQLNQDNRKPGKNLREAVSARIDMTLYDAVKDHPAAVFFNGRKAGNLSGNGYHAGIALPPECLALLEHENEIRIFNSGNGEAFTIASLQLAVFFPGDDALRSNVSSRIFTTVHNWDEWRAEELDFIPPGAAAMAICRL